MNDIYIRIAALMMSRFTLLVVCFSIMISGYAQHKQESEALVAKGKKSYDAKDFKTAAKYFQQAVVADSTNVNANLLAGVTLLNYSGADALQYLRRVRRLNSTMVPDIDYLIGLSLQKGYRFREAIDHYTTYKATLSGIKDKTKSPGPAETGKRILECETGIELVNHPRPIEIINVGSVINSEFADYGPVTDQAGSVLIFTSRRKTGNLNPSMENGSYFEDIFYSTKKDSLWQPVMNVGEPVNSMYHESVICLSSKGDRLFIYKDTGEGDVYISMLLQEGWSDPVPLQIVNSPYSERSMTISNSGDMIIFSSDRPGGFGGFDLYRTTFDGKYWSRPQNLGQRINTPEDDDAPALNGAGDKLYFSSKGLKGMGGFDIYVVDLPIESNPANLGYPINTPEDDVYLIPMPSEELAYFSSARSEGYGDLDIYLLRSLDGAIAPELTTKPEIVAREDKAPNMELKSIYFEFGKTQLLSSSEKTFLKNVKHLIDNPDVKVLLVGHTDNIGSDWENSILAMERAMKVAILLKQNGISENRISLEAMGECCPIESNDDADKIYMNRRVEFVLIKK